MSGRLTTHVLDTAQGRPAAALTIQLFRVDGEHTVLLKTLQTNADGRADAPLLSGADVVVATYQLVFFVADYFAQQPVTQAEPPFLDQIPIRFTISDPNAHYHVPLLVSPWAYSTYRGS
jgi:5-hydroxyisourate hydrolase